MGLRLQPHFSFYFSVFRVYIHWKGTLIDEKNTEHRLIRAGS